MIYDGFTRLLAITLLRLKKMADNLFSFTAAVMLLRFVAVSMFNQKFLEVKAVKSTDHILSLKQLLTIITKTNLIVWYRFSTRQISENMLFITDFVLSIITERAYVTMHGAAKIYEDNLKYLFLSICLFFMIKRMSIISRYNCQRKGILVEIVIW